MSLCHPASPKPYSITELGTASGAQFTGRNLRGQTDCTLSSISIRRLHPRADPGTTETDAPPLQGIRQDRVFRRGAFRSSRLNPLPRFGRFPTGYRHPRRRHDRNIGAEPAIVFFACGWSTASRCRSTDQQAILRASVACTATRAIAPKTGPERPCPCVDGRTLAKGCGDSKTTTSPMSSAINRYRHGSMCPGRHGAAKGRHCLLRVWRNRTIQRAQSPRASRAGMPVANPSHRPEGRWSARTQTIWGGLISDHRGCGRRSTDPSQPHSAAWDRSERSPNADGRRRTARQPAAA